MLLNSIHHPEDIKSFNPKQLLQLADELRSYIIDTILESGGHFAGNLGVIELTVALHSVLDFNEDTLIWDVGHQSYAHKCLTGRFENLPNIRSFGDISGFPKRDENACDHFGTGHSSTSISATMGMAVASQNSNSVHIAVIGDGALTAGMAYEALNNLWDSQLNVLIILNDNNMGIDPNTGALNSHLKDQQDSSIQQFIEFFGLTYHGPVDGHDLISLQTSINQLYPKKGPRLLHVKTTKGKGYPPAEQEQTKWHSAAKFVKVETPGPLQHNLSIKWQDVFGEALSHACTNHSEIIGITPAMPSSCGMMNTMEKFPNQIFDVGIAEQHALTFAAGFATSGKKPIVNIYSSFLQRAYDQWIHDIALQNLPVILCVDRAGLVGEDGPTHHGAFDISFLRCIPNTLLFAPQTGVELFHLICWSLNQNQPIAIRYPKGNIPDAQEFQQFQSNRNNNSSLKYNPYAPFWIQNNQDSNVLILTTGIATQLAIAANASHNISHLHLTAIHADASTSILKELLHFNHIITVEDGSIQGGWGVGIIQELLRFGWKGTHENLGIPHAFIPHGNNAKLYEVCGYSAKKISERIQQSIG
jgi:1-deoxy-D-xylulose-5-phosphate synthase